LPDKLRQAAITFANFLCKSIILSDEKVRSGYQIKIRRMKITPIYRKILLHIAWWVFYIGNYFIALYIRNPNPEWYFLDICLFFLSDIVFFYFFIHITAQYLFNEKTIWKGIGLFLVNAFILYGVEELRALAAYFDGKLNQVPKYFFQLHTLILAFLRDVIQFTGYGTLYWFYNRFYEQQKEKLALEQEKHRIEIGFLRGQINDYFSYNLLNMFHSQAAAHSDELADGILSLSELMRYSVAEQENSMVALEEELRHIQLLIALNKQRFESKAQVVFEIEGNTHHWQVPHLGLLTLVENCFKHGSVTQAPVVINLTLTPQMLVFKTQNRVKTTPSVVSTSLGLHNLARRLELLCPGRTSFRSQKEGANFFTELHISK
jgi:two-component system, LytTR family, sensor kinase